MNIYIKFLADILGCWDEVDAVLGDNNVVELSYTVIFQDTSWDKNY